MSGLGFSRSVALAAGVIMMFGCGVDVPDAGLLVRGAIRYTDDVGGFRYTLVEVDCEDGEPIAGVDVYTATVRAEELYRADDGGSVYGEHYFTLAPGCYDVASQPLRGDTDEPSAFCLPAHARGVEVVEGVTTELVLVSQCPGLAAVADRAPADEPAPLRG